MYILDQSNPFEAQTTAFSYRDTQIVQEYSQLFEYFLEMADKCSIINLNEHLLENSSLNVLRHRLLNGKMHFHFQLGNAERQFIRTLMNHEIQCTFEKIKQSLPYSTSIFSFLKKHPLLVSSSRPLKYLQHMSLLKKNQHILFCNRHSPLSFCSALLSSCSMKLLYSRYRRFI